MSSRFIRHRFADRTLDSPGPQAPDSARTAQCPIKKLAIGQMPPITKASPAPHIRTCLFDQPHAFFGGKPPKADRRTERR